MKNTSDKLQKFFELTGNETDSLIFLKSFRSIDPEKFLLIYLNPQVVIESFSTFFYDIKMLHSLGLIPIILLTQDSISYIELFYHFTFQSSGINSEAQPKCDKLLITEKFLENVKNSISKEHIPFLVLESEDNLFGSIANIVKSLKSNKLILLSANGALKQFSTNKKISMINIRSDYNSILEENLLKDEDLILLNELKDLLENKINHSMNIAITSPVTLLKELFTVGGSGTFIKLGSEIRHLKSIQETDSEKLKILLESAFRKKIESDFLNSKIDSIFLEINFRGAALLKETEYGFLLSKFAVDEIARGEGIGRDIWNEMKKKHKTIFWRAKSENQ
ncbi:MAG TPA: acetylglutamate kinase, partial [Leptospiraceae bacterium]|nr:acetylglutamate kinase [Leptospiraceae bacterium]